MIYIHLFLVFHVFFALQKGKVTSEKNPSDDAYRPNLGLFGVNSPPGCDFWGQCVRRPNSIVTKDSPIEHLGKAKVDEANFCILVVIFKKNIFKLEISVKDAAPMHVDDGPKDLLQNNRHSRLVHPPTCA